MRATVLKVGGSLALQPQKLKELCRTLDNISKTYPLVVVPGGGEFADTVRVLDSRFSLSCWASHRMSILGQDQYGLLLKDLTPNAVSVYTFDDAKEELRKNRLVIFLPSKLFFSEDPLENSWNVTSDSIAAFIACRMNVNKMVLITDVDGVYTENPKTRANARLLKEITAQELLSRKDRTSVDNFFC